MAKKFGYMLEQQKKGGIWSSIIISFFTASIYYMIVYKCFPMVYAINDDVAMRDIASGAFSGEPDAHLIFMKYVLGVLLSGIYRIFPGYDWYGILMTGLIVLCLGIFVYRGLSDIDDWKKKGCYLIGLLVIFACVGLQHLVIFQWTMTAGITGATGVFLFYTSSEKNKWRNILEEIVGALLLILTFCIRSDVLFMVAPAAGLCYLFKYVKMKGGERRRLYIQHAWFAVLLIGGCAAVMLIEKTAYQSEAWKEFQAFNNLRSEVYDFYGIPDFEENQDFYESINMDECEVQALENYSLFLVDGIYEYKMKEIADYARSITDKAGIIKRLNVGVQRVYSDFKSGTYVPLTWFTAIITILAVWVCWKRNSKQFYLIFACMGVQFLLWCYLGLQGRIVGRVSYAMHLYMLILAFSVLYWEMVKNPDQQIRGWRRESGILLGICSVLLCTIALLEWNELKQDALQIAKRNQENIELSRYLTDQKENVYLAHTYSISHYTDNFRFRREFEFSNIVPFGDWQTYSPIEMKKRERLGISDTRNDLYTQKDVYIVSRFDMAYVEECLQKAYGSCHAENADVVAFRDYLYWIIKYSE